MIKALHVLNSFAWVEGSYGCNLQNVETKHQMKTIKILLNSPLSFLLFVFFLVLLRLSFISLCSSLSPEISIISFSFNLIAIKRGSPSALVDFQGASYFQLIKLKNNIWPKYDALCSRRFLQSPSNVLV